MSMTASKLRENIYRVLDQVLESGVPVEITRRGGKLKIVREETDAGGKLGNLRPRPDLVTGDIEDLVHMDWSDEWKP